MPVTNKVFAVLATVALAGTAKAGTFTANFDSGTNAPPGSAIYGSAGGGVIEATGGVNNSGVLKLTKSVNGQTGSIIIDDLDAGVPVYGFDFSAKVRLGGGTSTPADGFSINFDPTIADGTVPGEEGTAGGMAFTFDIYDNGAETPPAPSIDVKVGGAVVATVHKAFADILTGNDFADLHITVSPAGSLSFAYKGEVLFTNLFFPGYQAIPGGRWAIGGRTGGLNANQWFDNISITTYTQSQVGISQQPQSQKVLQGHNAVFSVQITNPDGATYQWFRNGTAIAGATSADLTISNITAADEGSKFKVEVKGPNNTATSDEVTLSVGTLDLPAAPELSYTFENGATPAGSAIFGTAIVDTTGGVNNTGALKLTVAQNDQAGAIVIDDTHSGAPVYGFTAHFSALVGGGTVPPADGFSFNFATDIPDDPTIAPPQGFEDGVGTGLTVGFDIYDNGGGEAPSIDVRYKGQLVTSKKVPLSTIETGDSFGEAIIRLESDGTLDLAWKGVVIFDNLTIPGFSSISGGKFAIAARTGGANENVWIDNLEITPVLTSGSLRVSTQPSAQTVLVGKPATFTVVPNDATGVSFQWLKNGTAVNGATSATYTTPATAVADNGAKYKVQLTKGNLSVTSDEVSLSVVDLAAPASPTLSLDFNSGTTAPTGTVLVGSAGGGYIDTTGGVNGSGVLKLTDAINGEAGGFIIQPLIGGAELGGFTAAFDLLIGGGTVPPADGFSFNYASDLAEATGTEDGSGSGLTIGFDIYDNGNETPPAPSVDVRYKGALVSSVHLTFQELESGTDFRTLLVRVSADGKLDVAYGDRVLFHDLQLPNYTFTSNGKFGFYARTGGLNDNQWVDNIRIGAVKSALPLRFSQDVQDQAVLSGKTATFSAVLSDPTGATYQWFKNGTAIPGATGASYTTAAVTSADDGAKFKVQATGAGGTVISREAVLSYIAPITVTNPKVSFNFDDGALPAGTELNSSAGGGYFDAGVLKLTDANNGEGGTFVIADLDNGTPVSAFSAHFKVLIGGGTVPPADGMSFVWANDLTPGIIFGEDGSGSGLIVSIDIYDNGGGEAPAFNLRYGGVDISTNKVPISFIETGDQFVDASIRIEADGTFDFHYNGNVIFNNVKLPGYAPMSGGAFAFGGRTGGLNDNQWIDDVQIATSTGAAAPSISSITAQAGKITIQWAGTATLQSADAITGPWTDATGATSPYQANVTGAMKFYRLKQ